MDSAAEWWPEPIQFLWGDANVLTNATWEGGRIPGGINDNLRDGLER